MMWIGHFILDLFRTIFITAFPFFNRAICYPRERVHEEGVEPTLG